MIYNLFLLIFIDVAKVMLFSVPYKYCSQSKCLFVPLLFLLDSTYFILMLASVVAVGRVFIGNGRIGGPRVYGLLLCRYRIVVKMYCFILWDVTVF